MPDHGYGDLTKLTAVAGLTAWLARWEPNRNGNEQFGPGPAQLCIPPASEGASLIPVFADAIHAGAWSRADDPFPPNLVSSDRARQLPGKYPGENRIGRYTITQLRQGVNAVFLGGRAMLRRSFN